MERAKGVINELKVLLTDAVMGEDSALTLSEIKKIYRSINEIDSLIDAKKEEVLNIPRLPKGDKYNPYPRIIYAMICEYYTKEKYFTIADMMEVSGASRNQVKADLVRLEKDGFIRDNGSYVAERSTKYYAYEPTRLI